LVYLLYKQDTFISDSYENKINLYFKRPLYKFVNILWDDLEIIQETDFFK